MNQIIAEQMNNKLNNHKYNKQHPSAGRFFSIFSASAVTLLILFALNIFGILDFNNANNAYAVDSITLSISNSTLAINLFPDDTTGTFSKSSSANISVSTTSTSGYTLSIVGSNDTRNLVGSDTASGNNLSSIASSTTEATFSSNNESDYTIYNNKWGYMPSEYVNYVNDEPVSISNTGANAVFLPGPTTAGDILKVTDCANGATGCSSGADTVSIAIGARANSDMVKGTYANTFVIQAVTNFTAVECDDTKLCVQYDGNGLTFPATESQSERLVNNVNYDSVTTQQPMTKYSHTPNISDAGVQSGNYANSYTQNEVVTIDGASTLHIKLTYGGESASYDWVSFWAGNYPSYTAASNYFTGIQNCGGGTVTNGKYGGTSGTTVECDIAGPSVTFAFKSDSSGVGNGYGYYAVVTALPVRDRTLTSGEYATPTGTNAIFHGWSSTATTPGAGLPSSVEYADEAAVKSNMPGDNTETKTLYAVWQQPYPITFTMDSNVSSIAVVDDSGTTVGTITSSGQSLNLLGGNTYTLKPTYPTGYGTNSITKTTGAGTITTNLPNADFTVGAGTATINVSSKTLVTFDQAFAAAGKTKYNGYYKMQDANSTICSNVVLADLGNVGEVIDIRDNQVYKIGKLKDGKCWMLENLNLAGGTALSANDTDVTSAYISSFSTSNNLTKTGSTIVLPASSASGFDAVNKSYVYNSGNKTNCGASGQNTPCYSYYSWDAATLGSGRSISTDNTDAQQSICPKGWRLPTAYSTSATNWQTTSDFYALAHQYGLDSTTSTSESDADFYNQAGPGTTPGFLLAGFYNYYDHVRDGGSRGYYWSSTSYSSTEFARRLRFNSSSVDSAISDYRSFGHSVRCLVGS